jgi:hypothetical protein
MKVELVFRCPKCGLETPAIAQISDCANPKQPIVCAHDCFHCDEPLERRFKNPAALMAAAVKVLP